jgi:hypothetical protein
MKNKLLLIISAVGFMILISAPAFSQNSVPANAPSTTKQTIRAHVKPVSPSKEAPVKQSTVVPSNNKAATTGQTAHIHVKPVSAKEPSVSAQSTHSATVNKTVHPRIKPVTPVNSTPVK